MNIFITGATGFVGSALIPKLIEKNHKLNLLIRPGEKVRINSKKINISIGDPTETGEHWKPITDSDAAINLAGYPVFNRWNHKRKKLIKDSRIKTTQNLVRHIPDSTNFCLVNASGIGIYGDCKDQILYDDHSFGTDYLSSVASEWEEVATSAQEKGARVSLARFGIILGNTGGALPQMTKNIKYFGIGRIGSGLQWLPWIHIEDVVCGIIHIIENKNCSGSYNFTSPEPARQKDVAKLLGKKLRRHSLIPVHEALLRLAFGEFADVAISSQRAIPKRLLDSGYKFHFPELSSALDSIL